VLTKREEHEVLSEEWRRKLDRIYQGKRRAWLAQIYRGDPSDPAVLVRELLPRQQSQLSERDQVVTNEADATAVQR
jgi:hypothetical protein